MTLVSKPPKTPGRWLTCAPANFQGADAFFARDSGLLSKGFESLGLESRAISLGPAKPNDHPALIRATWGELTSVS